MKPFASTKEPACSTLCGSDSELPWENVNVMHSECVGGLTTSCSTVTNPPRKHNVAPGCTSFWTTVATVRGETGIAAFMDKYRNSGPCCLTVIDTNTVRDSPVSVCYRGRNIITFVFNGSILPSQEVISHWEETKTPCGELSEWSQGCESHGGHFPPNP